MLLHGILPAVNLFKENASGETATAAWKAVIEAIQGRIVSSGCILFKIILAVRGLAGTLKEKASIEFRNYLRGMCPCNSGEWAVGIETDMRTEVISP